MATIEENQNVGMMKVDEHIDSLEVYEITIPLPKTPKGVALKASSEEKIEYEDESEPILL